MRPRVTATLLCIGWLATLIAAAILIEGGIDIRMGRVLLRAHSPIAALVVAAICAGVAFRSGLAGVREGLAWLWTALPRAAPAIAATAAVIAVGIGLVWGTYAAGGTDSSCYLHQAELFASGRVREPQPLAIDAPWPRASATFVPIAFVPSPRAEIAIVPACPSGLPLLMAGARLLGGRPAMFWIVPLLGGCAVWLTYVLGRRVADARAACAAAVLLAASPTFLYQVTQPMSDVPALAAWTAALVAALRAPASTRWALAAGAASGAALLIRPNLLPLAIAAAAPICLIWPQGLRRLLWRLTAFGAGVLPFVAAIALLNAAMYGGPFSSGYGQLRDLFTVEHVAGNVRRYPLWLLETQTPFVLLAMAAPWVERDVCRRSLLWCLLAFAALTLACYVPYTVWEAWWFLRFLLPAFPVLLALSALVAVSWLGRLRPEWRSAVFALSLGALVLFQLITSAHRAVFQLKDLEARYRISGDYVTGRLPANAVLFAEIQSGSLSYYAGRPIVRWSLMDPQWLDRAIAFLKAEGYRPYFVVESEEEPEFRQHFAAGPGLGHLEWPPMADLNRQVRIYDPADRDRYLRGEKIETEFIYLPPASGRAPR